MFTMDFYIPVTVISFSQSERNRRPEVKGRYGTVVSKVLAQPSVEQKSRDQYISKHNM